MLLIIDNYDSFTYNLVQYFGELRAEMVIRRNDAITADEVEELRPEKIVISPGPGTPDQAGVSNELIARFGEKVPILGVCLGHQCIGHVYGGEVVRADKLMHGKTSPVFHDGRGLFAGLPNPMDATRYHSLIVKRATLPKTLRVTAESSDQEIMAVQHTSHPVYGVQFHPESILTREGKQLLQNFLNIKGPRA
jgi:anthranilate synthase/aminodeoxychorismate synthase-like glutamine amidotransferase